MEVEMKAKISVELANDIAENKLGKGWTISRGGGWRPIFKKDTYYAFDGITPKNPKTVIRTRAEATIGDDTSFDEIIKGKVNSVKSDLKTYLTTKVKSIGNLAIENNAEIEGELVDNAVCAFETAMEAANFAPYFEKRKTSISFYCSNENGQEIHCEIVNVNGIGPYLEIEAFVPDIDEKYLCSDEYHDAETAAAVIRDFFNKLDILEFEHRSWPEIIEQEGD